MRNLFHTGFAPGNLCYDPVTAALLVSTAVGVGSQVFQGYSANQEAKRTAGLQEDQARIALEDANTQADLKAKERAKFLAEQRMAYSANGISLSGTPLDVADSTYSDFQQEIDALRKSGVAQLRAGMMQAYNTKQSGRASMISGILGGIGTAAKGFSQYQSTKK